MKNRVLGTLIIPVGLFILLVPYSLIFGSKTAPILIYWFIIAPVGVIFLPMIVSKTHNHFIESLNGAVLFYGFMVFMIYKTDLLPVILASFGFVFFVLVVRIILKRFMFIKK